MRATTSAPTRSCAWKRGWSALKRIAAYAEKKGALILLENLNKEPEDAEVHYLAHTVEEWRYYFERIQSPAFGSPSPPTTRTSCPKASRDSSMRSIWRRWLEVRLADCFRNGYEVHLKPGAGDLDFGDMFRRIEGKGFKGHYTNAFTTLDDMLWARDYLAAAAEQAGVPI